MTAAERACRVCGCTDAHGCANGCWWVELDLCSNCTPSALAGRVVADEITAYSARVAQPRRHWQRGPIARRYRGHVVKLEK